MLDKAPQTKRVFDFIKSEIEAGRGFPSHREIAAALGYNDKSKVGDALARLVRHGLLRRNGYGRTVRWEIV